jgi:CMP-N,N'-diacetyllegionaminic acid synthase
MRILALILARGGSKRLPGKNIRLLGGRPLISWSIDTAKLIPEVCDILVSTDSLEIQNTAKKLGAYAPWLRPKNLSTDSSSSIDAALHALDWYESKHGTIDGLLLLQPTSPFRSLEKMKEGVKLFSIDGCNSVLGVSPTHAHPKWTFRIGNGQLSPFLSDHGLDVRSQDLEPVYVINGSFYLISPCYLRHEKSFFIEGAMPLVIDSNVESLDIDTQQDWQYAEYFISMSKK